MSGSNQSANQPSPGYYIPGAKGRKLLMILFGLALFFFPLTEIWIPVRLLCFGVRATAEATRVIKSVPGSPDQVISDTVTLAAAAEGQNRSYTFTNEFRFRTVDGREFFARPSTGSVVKPLYPLIDSDGLPAITTVYYDPHHPETVVFPLMMSTWFIPCVLGSLGLLCALIGSFLFYWADKPIELPHMPTAAELNTLHSNPKL